MNTEACAYFPRGLHQPEGGFRFSADALFLAAFAAEALTPKAEVFQVADLGAGCGVIGLGLAILLKSRVHTTGFDRDTAMIHSAERNAEALQLQSCYTAASCDLRRIRSTDFSAESFDAVTANPPYRRPGTGRVSADSARIPARFETEGEVSDFLDAAAYLLRNRGRLFTVFLAERMPDLIMEMRTRRLEPKRIRFVHGRPGAPARLILLEARKNSGPGLEVEPPLFHYGDGSEVTPEALAFCPFLACNAGK